MNVLDLFSGCGGISEGFRQEGFEAKGFVEYWKPAIDTYLANFPEAKLVCRDVTKFNFSALLDGYDVIVGGPPCQGFSMAGKRKVGDKRNTLFEYYLKFVEKVNPSVCVMENVKGIYTMEANDGELIWKKIVKGFEGIGYKVRAKVLNAANYGTPQNRERVIFIAAKDEKLIVFPDWIKEKVFVKDVLDLPYEPIEELDHVYCKSKKNFVRAHYLKEGDCYSTFHSAGKKLKIDGYAPTITKSGRFIHPRFNRFLSVRECARIQGFPDSFKFCGNIGNKYGQIGNAVPVTLAKAIAKKIKEAI